MITGKLIECPEGCHKCGNETAFVTRRGPHLRMTCGQCGAYIRFISKETCLSLGVDPEKLKDLENGPDKPEPEIDQLTRVESAIEQLTDLVREIHLLVDFHIGAGYRSANFPGKKEVPF
jgi:hypothetical protein